MSTNHKIKGRVFDFDCCPYVEFQGYCMLGMCDVRDVVCSRMQGVRYVGYSGCGMFGMWDVGDVGCSGCGIFRMWDVGDVGMFGMWDVRDVGCSGCGVFGMQDFRDVGCGMWDVDLQNALQISILNLRRYLISRLN